jgi:hypothetical protein
MDETKAAVVITILVITFAMWVIIKDNYFKANPIFNCVECGDPDGGNNPDVASTVMCGSMSLPDQCSPDGVTLSEFYCISNKQATYASIQKPGYSCRDNTLTNTPICEYYGFFTTKPINSNCEYALRPITGTYCYSNCVGGQIPTTTLTSTTTPTIPLTCEQAGYLTYAGSGQTCQNIYVPTLNRNCYLCQTPSTTPSTTIPHTTSSTTTTTTTPCIGCTGNPNNTIYALLGITIIGLIAFLAIQTKKK